MNGSDAWPRALHLLHAASGLTLTHVVSSETRVDVGTIAAHFSLQPNSLLFNGYFISRDAHFISGLTWVELLKFFQSRGLNRGSQALNLIEVQGRPLMQLPNEANLSSDSGHLCYDKYQSGKRSVLQSSFVSPSKRTKSEIDSGMPTSSLIPCKLKRHVCPDESVFSIWNKRMQPSKKYSRWEVTSSESCLGSEKPCGSKRQRPLIDGCTEGSLWKKFKEVKV